MTTIQHLDGCDSFYPLSELCHCPCPMDLVDDPVIKHVYAPDEDNFMQITWRCCAHGITVNSPTMRMFPEQLRAWHLSLSQHASPTDPDPDEDDE